jgi:hypothetical protein
MIRTLFLNQTRLTKNILKKCFSNEALVREVKDGIQKLRIHEDIHLKPAQLDWNYILNVDNLTRIKENIHNRKGVGDIEQVV